MKTWVTLAAVVALGACDAAGPPQTDTAATPAADSAVAADGVAANSDAGFEAVAPGKYEVARADGSIDQLTITPGMIWSMVPADGEPAGGTIFAQDGKNCFVTEGVEGHQCFEGTDPAADGSMKVTAEDGEVMTVRPVDTVD